MTKHYHSILGTWLMLLEQNELCNNHNKTIIFDDFDEKHSGKLLNFWFKIHESIFRWKYKKLPHHLEINIVVDGKIWKNEYFLFWRENFWFFHRYFYIYQVPAIGNILLILKTETRKIQFHNLSAEIWGSVYNSFTFHLV